MFPVVTVRPRWMKNWNMMVISSCIIIFMSILFVYTIEYILLLIYDPSACSKNRWENDRTALLNLNNNSRMKIRIWYNRINQVIQSSQVWINVNTINVYDAKEYKRLECDAFQTVRVLSRRALFEKYYLWHFTFYSKQTLITLHYFNNFNNSWKNLQLNIFFRPSLLYCPCSFESTGTACTGPMFTSCHVTLSSCQYTWCYQSDSYQQYTIWLISGNTTY